MAASLRTARCAVHQIGIQANFYARFGNPGRAFFLTRMLCTESSQSSDAREGSVSEGDTAIGNAGTGKAKKISQAMQAYLERARSHEEFMKAEVAEYEIGKRHLASIMGEDPNTFTQEDVDRAIRYLLPSSLYDKKARPLMRHPDEVIPQRKAAQFDIEGRPFHTMFYSGKPNFFQLLHDAAKLTENLQAFEDEQLARGARPKAENQVQLSGSQWIPQRDLEECLKENITEREYERFTKVFQRLAVQPYSKREKAFIMDHRKIIQSQTMLDEVPPLKHDVHGRAYMDGSAKRKTAMAEVCVWAKGSGKVSVNGAALLDHFPRILDRQQLLFPLQFCGIIADVDVEIKVDKGGESGQAGAARLAMSRALQSFVSRDMREKMRIAGLLSHDPRRRERKKPGQEGARRKFTWKKR